MGKKGVATKFACVTDLTLSAKNKNIRTVTDLTLARFCLSKQCCLYLRDLSDTVSLCLWYRPPTELWEGNVFSCVCLTITHNVLDLRTPQPQLCPPSRHGTWGPVEYFFVNRVFTAVEEKFRKCIVFA